MSYFEKDKAPVCFFAGAQPLVGQMHAEGRKLLKALGVIALDPKIRNWLQKNDPKALAQVDEARGTKFEVIHEDDGLIESTHDTFNDATGHILDNFGHAAAYFVRPK